MWYRGRTRRGGEPQVVVRSIEMCMASASCARSGEGRAGVRRASEPCREGMAVAGSDSASGRTGRGQRSKYRVKMSIQRSPSRFVRVQRVQGEWARGQQSQLWLEGGRATSSTALGWAAGLGRAGRAEGGRLRGERVLTLAVFDAFAGWPKTTERRETRSAACVPSSALSGRLASLPRQAPTDTSSLRSLSRSLL